MLFFIAAVLVVCLVAGEWFGWRWLAALALVFIAADAKAAPGDPAAQDALGRYLGQATEEWMTAGKVYVKKVCPSESLGPLPECGVPESDLRAFERQEKETWWQVRDRFRTSAKVVAKVVLAHAPIFVEDGSRADTGLLLMSIAFNETRFRGFVADGRCNDETWRNSKEGLELMKMGDCDSGKARTVFQLQDFLVSRRRRGRGGRPRSCTRFLHRPRGPQKLHGRGEGHATRHSSGGLASARACRALRESASFPPMTLEAWPLSDGDVVYDCFSPLTQAVLDALEASGKMPRAFGRYVENFSEDEKLAILAKGAGYFLIHTARMPYKWTPSGAMGKADGQDLVFVAGTGTPSETCLVLDFETPAFGTTADEQVDYLNSGFAIIANAGFTATLYEGYGNLLSPVDLYKRLICPSYWKSASAVVPVATRGYRLEQEKIQQMISAHLFDTSTAHVDSLGGRFMAAFDPTKARAA